MDSHAALAQLQQPRDLSILFLANPIRDPDSLRDANRNSYGSDSSTSISPTPALLSADLAHYRDLFSKLRFSYVEQVTKERFLRAVTSDVPEFVDGRDNATLEHKLTEDKADLKAKKEEVAALIEGLEEQGRNLANRYEQIQLQTARLENLPADIENLQRTIDTLQAVQGPKSANPALSLPLKPTLDIVAERETQLADIDQQIAALQATLPSRRQEVARLHDELAPLEARKITAAQEAQAARQRKDAGKGSGDDLDEKGRWLRGVESSLRNMLEV